MSADRKRYPIDPLLRRFDIEIRVGRPAEDHEPGVDTLLELLGEFSRPSWRRRGPWPPTKRLVRTWTEEGCTAEQADWLACKLADVPVFDLWPDWDDDGEIEDAAHE